MRKITEEAVEAFVNGREFCKSNTTVSVVDEHDIALSLFGHIIAMKDMRTGLVKINNKGYETNTTKERLNGIIDEVRGASMRIYQRAGEWYWDVHGERQEFPCAEWVTL